MSALKNRRVPEPKGPVRAPVRRPATHQRAGGVTHRVRSEGSGKTLRMRRQSIRNTRCGHKRRTSATPKTRPPASLVWGGARRRTSPGGIPRPPGGYGVGDWLQFGGGGGLYGNVPQGDNPSARGIFRTRPEKSEAEYSAPPTSSVRWKERGPGIVIRFRNTMQQRHQQ